MRLLAVNCIILVCVAIALAEETTRPKRHLLEWKDLLLAKLFGVKPHSTQPASTAPVLVKQDGDVRIYRMPGYDDVLVKAVPKAVAKPVVVEEATAPEDPLIAIIQSYLGTETPEDTVEALEGIRNLLKSGIILRPKPIAIPPAPKIQPFRVVPTMFFSPEPVQEMEVLPNLPSYYSYKQFSNNEDTSYSSHNKEEAVVTETKDTLPLPPPYVMERFQNIWRELPGTSKVIGPLKPLPPPPQVIVPTRFFAPEPVKKMEVLPTSPSHYSYKKFSNHGDTSYSSHNKGEAVVTETKDTLPLPPPYVMERFQNIWRELPVTSKIIGPLKPLPPPPQVIVPTRFFAPEPVKKMEVLPTLPSHYSYKQFSNHGDTSYSSDNNGEVVVTETKDSLPLPPYVMERFKNIWRELPVISKVIRPFKPLPEIKGFLIPQPAVYQSPPVVRPVVNLPEEIIEVPSYRPAPLPVAPEYYRLPELYVNHDCNNKRKGTNEPHVSCFVDAPEKPASNTQDVKLSYYNQDPNKWHGATHWSSAQANIPSSYSYSQFYKDGSFMTQRKDQGDAVNVMKSDNLRPVHYFSESNRNQDALTTSSANPIPVQPITITRKEILRDDRNSRVQYSHKEETKTNLDSSKSGAVYFKKPIPSSYMFQLVNHRDQTRPSTIVRVGDTIQTDSIPSFSIDNQSNQLPAAWNEEFIKQYVYIPPEMSSGPEIPSGSVIGTEPLKDQQNSASKVNIISYEQMSNARTMANRNNRNAEFKEETTATSKPEETVSSSTTNSWMSSPIPIPGPHYNYQHSKLDGPKITISGNSKAGVTVETDVKSDKNVLENSRGASS